MDDQNIDPQKWEAAPHNINICLFDFLTSGCATDDEIKQLFEKTFSTPITESNRFSIFSRLRNGHLLQSARYYDSTIAKNFTLYSNTADSIGKLLNEKTMLLQGARYNRLRMRDPFLPGKYAFYHEKDLTKIVRKIREDAPGNYEYTFRDELCLKSTAKTKKDEKFPDLELTIRWRGHVKDALYRIELQRTFDGIQKLAWKLTKSSNNIVICDGKDLLDAITQVPGTCADRSFFTLKEDFLINGFDSTWFRVLAGKSIFQSKLEYFKTYAPY